MRRSFIAIPMPEKVQDALSAVQDRLRCGRLVDPENFHLTLAFLDHQSDASLAALDEELARIALAPFELQPHGLGAFGGRAPKTLWAGIADTTDLARLHDKVRGAVRLAGLDLPRKRFRPHVTLARFGPALDPADLERIRLVLERMHAFPCPSFQVDQFELVESRLYREGPVYTALADYPFSRNTMPAR